MCKGYDVVALTHTLNLCPGRNCLCCRILLLTNWSASHLNHLKGDRNPAPICALSTRHHLRADCPCLVRSVYLWCTMRGGLSVQETAGKNFARANRSIRRTPCPSHQNVVNRPSSLPWSHGVSEAAARFFFHHGLSNEGNCTIRGWLHVLLTCRSLPPQISFAPSYYSYSLSAVLTLHGAEPGVKREPPVTCCAHHRFSSSSNSSRVCRLFREYAMRLYKWLGRLACFSSRTRTASSVNWR
jgi:hypothetical protein